MKFCPNCGSPLKNKDVCECGFSKDEYNKEQETKVEQPVYFSEPPYQDMGSSYEPMLLNSIPLEELKRRRVELGNLEGISFDTAGGMEGCYFYKDVDFNKSIVTVVERPNHNAKQIRKTYSADKKILEDLKKIILDNNIVAWKEVPVNRAMIAMDMPTSYFSIKFEEGSSRISTLINIDEEEREIYKSVIDLVNSLIDEKNKTSEEEDKTGGAMNPIGLGLINIEEGGFCPDCGCFIKNDQKKCICGFEKEK